MGEVVGVGLISHVPTIMLSPEIRRELNDGHEISLVPGLRRIRQEVLDPLDVDTIIVLDTHWASTVELLITAHDRRRGAYTSDELPRGMSGVPYDLRGDPELAHGIAAAVNDAGSWGTAVDDPLLPIHYPVVNLAHYLHRGERWIALSTVQTGQSEDFLLFGQALAAAIAPLDRRVVILASGGMSHRFWPLRELRAREASDPVHLRTPDARIADETRIEQMRRGDHRAIIESMDDYAHYAPEGKFGHYLTMIAAVGGVACTARGEQYSDYENSIGTGQVHMWFPRPDAGWTAPRDQ